jgi:hypothetical protein
MYDSRRGVCVLLLCGFPSTVLLDVVFAEGRTYVRTSGKRDSTRRKFVSFVHTPTMEVRLRNIKMNGQMGYMKEILHRDTFILLKK